MTTARIIAAGGGGANDSLPLDKLLAQWIGPNGRILYLPIALAGRGIAFADCLDWITATMKPLGIWDITMWTDLSAADHAELSRFDVVYIGGGNTFSLLSQMRASGFDSPLTRFIAQGGIVYGGSAGAIVLGRDILTCAHLDNNIVGLTNTRGLDVLDGYCIWCHYETADDERISAFVTRHGCPVLAVSERAGVSVAAGKIMACGYEPMYLFTVDGKQTINIGSFVR